MSFRHEINGLRAYAILAVLIFHFNPDLLPGGFAGVDVFFVISGYLMSKIILTRMEINNFSLREFYYARAKRILPPLIVICSLLIIFGYFNLGISKYSELIKHIAGSLTFLSNIIYWQESGYFDTASHEKWLLHTWSLSVEWQFYLLYPIFLLLAKRLFSLKSLKVLIIISFIFSLIISIVQSNTSPNAAYYLLQTRAWEMLLGAIAFIYPIQTTARKAKFLEIAGVLLIVYSYIMISSNDIWPGYLALIPTFGAYLVIISNHSGFLTNNIFTRPIGKWSYSIYLWHWPLMVFSQSSPYKISYISLIFISVTLGMLSYFIIEKNSSKINLKAASALTILITIIAMFINSNDHEKIKVKMEKIETSSKIESTQCFKYSDSVCSFDNTPKIPDFIFIGDSHAGMFRSIFKDIAEENKLKGAYLFRNGMVPLSNIYSLRNDQKKHNHYLLKEDAYKIISEEKIKNVFLIARWTYYTTGDYKGLEFSKLSLDSKDKTRKQSYEEFKIAFDNTVKELKKNNVNIHVILQVPQQKEMPVSIYESSFNSRTPEETLASLSVSTQDNAKMQNEVNTFIYKYRHQVNIIDPTKLMCNDDKCLVGTIDNSYYFDDDHLSTIGTYKFKAILSGILSGI